MRKRAAHGEPLGNGRTFGENCGVLFDETNHPTGDLYAAMLAVWVGSPPAAGPALGLALMVSLSLLALGRRSPWLALLVAGGTVLAAWGVPSFHAFMVMPSEGAWAIGSLFVLAAAATAQRPVWPMLLGCALAAMSSIAFVTIYAGLVAGALLAAHGPSWTIVRAGIAGIVGFVGVHLLRVVQTWCYADWSWTRVVDLVFTGEGYGSSGTMATSVMVRVTGMPFAERWAALWQWFPAYAEAALSAAWSEPVAWLGFAGLCALAPTAPWGRVGVALYWCGFLGFWLLAPGALGEQHLHLLPRLVVFLPLGTLLVLAAQRREA